MLEQKARVSSTMRDIIIIVAGVAIVLLGLYIALGTVNPFYVVSSGSMIPTLQVNDVLIINGRISFDELKVGDIIVFNRPDGEDKVIVHRVVDIDENQNGDRTLRTKGDANSASIPGTDYPIREKHYLGKVTTVIPGVGLIAKAISPPVNYIIIAIILVVLFFTKMGRKKDHDSGSAAPPSPGEPQSK